jgi:hypothetical protein
MNTAFQQLKLLLTTYDEHKDKVTVDTTATYVEFHIHAVPLTLRLWRSGDWELVVPE